MQKELAAAALETQAACPTEQEAASVSEIGRPPDRPPGREGRSVDPAPVLELGPAVRAVPPALADPGVAVPGAVAGEDAAEHRFAWRLKEENRDIHQADNRICTNRHFDGFPRRGAGPAENV